MPKTAREVIQEAMHEVGNDHGWNAIVLSALDAAGFVIVERGPHQHCLKCGRLMSGGVLAYIPIEHVDCDSVLLPTDEAAPTKDSPNG